jgi:two-component system, sensor histidine kinase and response regulator
VSVKLAEALAAASKTIVSSQLLHDLRSPLNQIIGYSEMLIEEATGQCQDGFVTDLVRVRASGHQLLAVIEENFLSEIDSPDATTSLADETLRLRRDAAPDRSGVAPGLLLVVDDDANNRDVLSRRLVRQGHVVETASNGRDALVRMRAVAFDAVLLDIMMPDLDGYEVLREIKSDEALQHIPVIMISALNEVQSVVRCIEAGAEDYLAKPFDPTLLKARIGASLEKKRGRDREAALYEESQKNFTRLQEVEKLREDMRNMIVHDLRTPLTSLIVGIEMLGKVGTLNETQQPMMSIAVGGGKTLLGMINDLLDVEKMESGSTQLHHEQLSATALIEGAVAQVASLAADGETTLVTDVPGDLPLFRGDQNKLSRTLVNLIANAIKFARRGTVTVSASHDGANIRFAVRDTGEGIPVESFGRIFEKFGQLDSNRVGTGLGLAFCKLAVEAHGGSIDVESTVGAGSVFSFTIPV